MAVAELRLLPAGSAGAASGVVEAAAAAADEFDLRGEGWRIGMSVGSSSRDRLLPMG